MPRAAVIPAVCRPRPRRPRSERYGLAQMGFPRTITRRAGPCGAHGRRAGRRRPRVAGRVACRSRRVLDRRHLGRARPRGAVGACGAAARAGRRGSDRGAIAGRHAARRRVLGRCIDRGDAGRRTRAGGGRRATSIARLAGAARTRAAIRSTPDRLGGDGDSARRGGRGRSLGRGSRRSGARGRAHR